MTISNKDALQEGWHVGYANRTIDLAVAPVSNIASLVAKGVITITSSDTKVVTVNGLVMSAVGVGAARITIKLGTLTDHFDVIVGKSTGTIVADFPCIGAGYSYPVTFDGEEGVESLYEVAKWTVEAPEGVKVSLSSDEGKSVTVTAAADSGFGNIKLSAKSSSYSSIEAPTLTIPVVAVSPLENGLRSSTVDYVSTGLSSSGLSSASTVTMSYDGVSDTAEACYEKLFVTFGKGSYAKSSYKEWMLAKNGGTLSLDAGTRKIEKLAFDTYKTTAFKVYAGADDKATEITPTMGTGAKGNLYTFETNSSKVFVKVTDTAYDLSIYSMVANVRFGERPAPTSLEIGANKVSLGAGDNAKVTLNKVLPADAFNTVTWSLAKTDGVVASLTEESGDSTSVVIASDSAVGSVTVKATSTADTTISAEVTIPVLATTAISNGARYGTLTAENSNLPLTAGDEKVTSLVPVFNDTATKYYEKGSVVFSAGSYVSSDEIVLPKNGGSVSSKNVFEQATYVTFDFYKYNNITVYAGADNTGTKILPYETKTDGDHLYVTYDVYGSGFYAVNETTKYNVSINSMTIGYWKGDISVPTALAIANKTVATVNVKEDLQLSTSFTPAKVTNARVKWTSSDNTKATVDLDGKVTGVAVGTVTITATSVAVPTLTDTIEITVNPEAKYTSVAKFDYSELPYVSTGYGALDNAGVLALFTADTYKTTGANPVTAVTVANAYTGNPEQGPKQLGLKLGSGKAAGTIAFTTSSEIARIVVTAYAWSTSKLATISAEGREVDLVADDATKVRTITLSFPATSSFTLASSIYSVITGIEFFGVGA